MIYKWFNPSSRVRTMHHQIPLNQWRTVCALRTAYMAGVEVVCFYVVDGVGVVG